MQIGYCSVLIDIKHRFSVNDVIFMQTDHDSSFLEQVMLLSQYVLITLYFGINMTSGDEDKQNKKIQSLWVWSQDFNPTSVRISNEIFRANTRVIAISPIIKQWQFPYRFYTIKCPLRQKLWPWKISRPIRKIDHWNGNYWWQAEKSPQICTSPSF